MTRNAKPLEGSILHIGSLGADAYITLDTRQKWNIEHMTEQEVHLTRKGIRLVLSRHMFVRLFVWSEVN